MYVVYNPFYPPDLAHYESRNASPDRSHNETWDSLVITGVIGLLAYQFLFITFFMYGFKSVGMMPTNRARNIFIGLWVGLGLAGGLGFIAVGQPKYFGMGVPGGILAGIILYLIIFSIFFYNREQSITLRSEDRLLFAGLLAGVVAHYIEIHFGIAIASTRVLFWVFAGMMVVAGSGWVQTEEVAPAPVKPAPQPKRATVPANVPRHKKRRQVQRPPERPTSTTQPIPAWVGSVAGYAFITAIIFSTLFYEFVTNAERLSEPTSIVWRALTFLALKQTSSSLVLLMFIFVWIIATVIAIAEMVRGGVFTKSGDWLAGLMLFASISMGLALVFALGLAGQLGNLARTPAARIEDVVAISDRVAGMFNYYYVGVFTLLLLASLALVAENKRLPVAWSTIRPIAWAVGLLLLLVYAVLGWAVPSLVYAVADIALVGSLLVLIASFLPQVKSDQKVIPYLLGIMLTNLITGTYMWVNYSNLDPIRADIIYKQADPYDKQGQWDVSIAHYKHAIELAPNEDFYYLWLGRAYLEKSSSANVTPKPLFNEQTQLDGILHLSVQQTAGLSRTDLLYAARAVLLRARAINPLNTDHSANLARLERRWADLSTDPAEKAKHAELSSQYYAQATSLSPHNAILWNEWALVELVRGNTDSAQQKLEQSIKLDDQFDQTFLLLGQLYLNKQDLSHAAEAYEKSLALNPSLMQAQGELAYVYAQQGKVSEAIQANLNLIKLAPDDPSVWNTHKNLAILYAQAGNFQSALNEARIAASIAPTTPTNYQAQLNDLIKQLGAQLAAPPPQVTATVPTTK
jgi:tetratricopeptide (TPR) repeat protein